MVSHMDRLQPLRTFARVAEMLSFSKAAESLGLPKASVSLQVRQLEDEIGARLLQRTTRRVRLTQDGQAFYQRTKDTLADLDELTGMFRSDAARITGRIRIDMSSRMARLHIIPKLPTFLLAHPNVEIELGASDRRVDLVQEDYDCVIRAGKPGESSLIGRQIGAARIINAASPAYLERHGTPRSLADLAQHHLIEYVSAFGERPGGFEYFDGENYCTVPMKCRVTVNSAESYAAACEAGLGIIQSPAASLRSAIRAGKLAEILPKLKAEPLPIYILYPHRRHVPTRVRLFMAWIEKILSGTYR